MNNFSLPCVKFTTHPISHLKSLPQEAVQRRRRRRRWQYFIITATASHSISSKSCSVLFCVEFLFFFRFQSPRPRSSRLRDSKVSRSTKLLPFSWDCWWDGWQVSTEIRFTFSSSTFSPFLKRLPRKATCIYTSGSVVLVVVVEDDVERLWDRQWEGNKESLLLDRCKFLRWDGNREIRSNQKLTMVGI